MAKIQFKTAVGWADEMARGMELNNVRINHIYAKMLRAIEEM